MSDISVSRRTEIYKEIDASNSCKATIYHGSKTAELTFKLDTRVSEKVIWSIYEFLETVKDHIKL